ncbi:SGNH/GDSL hydrolase family protein [Litoribrevibacter albus]|uniref:SGNH hydrolase-type esterase domain-containing protein n=1 Tax=Litoribrevibacter albus TaxID=1473156 RepID=A0AA37SBQ4_9GAMM|nr:SGNH/GDSL hydrolase family protein [Litoribrevibacter albus]GLQ31577.1 hypothetical protein GCM10007876_20560 [Litoribrevibacter albus]
MLNTLSTLLLLPILLPQGIYVRLTTPKLPEAKGERSGVLGQGNPLSVLILGDSAAAGVGVDCQSQALSGQLIERLKAHYQIEWRLEAKTGDKTLDVIERLETLDAFEVDVVITSIGVNDVTSSVSPNDWYHQQQRMIDLLKDKFSVGSVLMTPVPPMHMFPALPQPLRWCLGLRARELNAHLKKLIHANENCSLIEPGFELDHSLMASDGFHPGPKLYEQWAEALTQHIYRFQPK